jgi:hypothetical protein
MAASRRTSSKERWLRLAEDWIRLAEQVDKKAPSVQAFHLKKVKVN